MSKPTTKSLEVAREVGAIFDWTSEEISAMAEAIEAAYGAQSPKVEESLSHEEILKEITAWQHEWMNVTGTDERDRKNYFERSAGIDANMRYSLAKRLRARIEGKV